MNLEAEALSGMFGQGLWIERAVGRDRFLERLDDLLGELVATVGAALLGQKPGQALALERRLRLVKNGTREAEGGTNLRHRLLVHRDATHHLVLGLDKVGSMNAVREGLVEVLAMLRIKSPSFGCPTIPPAKTLDTRVINTAVRMALSSRHR